jgi:hypothetical protein
MTTIPFRCYIKPQHITQGKRDVCVGCPVELAIRDATGQRFLVGSSMICKTGGGGGPDFPLPKAVSNWIRNWDAGKVCKPMSFLLEVAA